MLGDAADGPRVLIRQGFFPLDTRVRREVEGLLDGGHEVDVICVRRPGSRGASGAAASPCTDCRCATRPEGGARYVLRYPAFVLTAAFLAAVLHAAAPLGRRPGEHDARLARLRPSSRGCSARGWCSTCTSACPSSWRQVRVGPRHPAGAARGGRRAGSIRFADRVDHLHGGDARRVRRPRRARGEDRRRPQLRRRGDLRRRRHPPRPREPGRFTLVCHGSIEERYGHDTLDARRSALLRDEIPGPAPGGLRRGHLPRRGRRAGAPARRRGSGRFARDYVPIEQLLNGLAQSDAGVVAMKKDAFRDLTHCNKMYDFVAEDYHEEWLVEETEAGGNPAMPLVDSAQRARGRSPRRPRGCTAA